MGFPCRSGQNSMKSVRASPPARGDLNGIWPERQIAPRWWGGEIRSASERISRGTRRRTKGLMKDKNNLLTFFAILRSKNLNSSEMRSSPRADEKVSLGNSITLSSSSKRRSIVSSLNVAFIGLALAVFAWGTQYKISLYDPPQAGSHQVPPAKLFSEDQQTALSKSSLIHRSPISDTRCTANAPWVGMYSDYVTLQFCGLPITPALGRGELRALRLWTLRRRAILSTFSFRPPPVTA